MPAPASPAAPAVSPTLSAASKTQPGWLRSPTFDLSFIVVIAAISIAAGVVGMAHPKVFQIVLLLDIWLLGYHHVVSTFTRLAFDKQSLREHRFLVFQLPVIILAATSWAVWVFGWWVLPTTYLYWQWFHYTRQSYGIERAYRRKADPESSINDYITTRALYLVPLFGIIYRSYQHQPKFLGSDVAYIPVNQTLVWITGGLALVGFAAWLAQVSYAISQRKLPVAHALYVLTHHIIFATGYFLIEDITTGWLVLNVWHNTQYILFVWLFNNNRFRKGVDDKSRFLSTISQTKNAFAYFGICVLISTVAYFLLGQATDGMGKATAIPLTLLIFMVINFHHYVVDGIIWKKKRKKPAASVQPSAA